SRCSPEASEARPTAASRTAVGFRRRLRYLRSEARRTQGRHSTGPSGRRQNDRAKRPGAGAESSSAGLTLQVRFSDSFVGAGSDSLLAISLEEREPASSSSRVGRLRILVVRHTSRGVEVSMSIVRTIVLGVFFGLIGCSGSPTSSGTPTAKDNGKDNGKD